MLRPSSVGFADSNPPRLPLGGNSARKARNRKQVAPLIRLLPQTPSPQGEGYIKGNYLKIQTVCSSPLRNGQCPPPEGKP